MFSCMGMSCSSLSPIFVSVDASKFNISLAGLITLSLLLNMFSCFYTVKTIFYLFL